jgi:flagellar biosynthesis regulator FlbT
MTCECEFGRPCSKVTNCYMDQEIADKLEDIAELVVELAALRAERDAADIEATALVVAMAEKYGVPDNWEPLADVAGKITQISNMAAALRAELVASEQKRVDEYIAGELLRAERDALRELLLDMRQHQGAIQPYVKRIDAALEPSTNSTEVSSELTLERQP